MSIIETAIRQAKNRPEKVADVPEARQQQELRSAPHAAVVESSAAKARQFTSASIDRRTMEQHGVLLQLNDDVAQRAYKILRTRVQQRMAAQRWSSLAVTAAVEGEGKTLTAINLSIALASDMNARVFLVDLDLQRPKVAAYLGLKFDAGLSDYLEGEATFDEIVYCPEGVERLAVIPNGRTLSQSSELLVSPRMLELRRQLAAEAPRRLQVFDVPPLLLSDDVLRFSSHVDSLLLVVSEGLASRSVLERARETLNEMNLLGVVLNRSAERQESVYY